MSKRSAELSKAEWSVMEALWECSRGTASELQKRLEHQQGWAYSTVKTMLDRLVEKGFVKSRRVGNVYEYSPRVKRTSVAARVMDDVFDRVLEGTLTPFLDRLIERRKLSTDEVDELRQMLDRYSDDK